MTSVLTPILPETISHNQAAVADAATSLAFQKQETREYLADMLKELSAIAAWAELGRAQQYIDAALEEVEATEAAE
ncbi:MAG: hypothetical protein ACLPX9_18150 [Rhodomicrobium sp.]